MDSILTRMVGLLCAAILVAIIARRLRLPYTVGLVVAGIGLASSRLETTATLTHDFIFDVILPPLLFEAALSIHWRELRRNMPPILTLSVLGVVISAGVVASGIVLLLHWPLQSALIFGVLIAATDPIAVIAMFKDTGIKGRLRLLVESESLFNDGIAAVFFAVVLAWAQTSTTETAMVDDIASKLLLMTSGGVLIGLASGGMAILVAGRTSDHMVETTLTAVAAYGSFLLAEQLHFSGVMATVSAGLLMGNLGVLRSDDQNIPSTEGRAFVILFWEFAAFIANSLIFLLIGLTVARILFNRTGIADLSVIIGLVFLGRALTVYPISVAFHGSRWAVPLREQHILWWGGLRGALALALALALPRSLPYHDEILIASFGTVVFSVVFQGLTMPLLLRRLGFKAVRD